MLLSSSEACKSSERNQTRSRAVVSRLQRLRTSSVWPSTVARHHWAQHREGTGSGSRRALPPVFLARALPRNPSRRSCLLWPVGTVEPWEPCVLRCAGPRFETTPARPLRLAAVIGEEEAMAGGELQRRGGSPIFRRYNNVGFVCGIAIRGDIRVTHA